MNTKDSDISLCCLLNQTLQEIYYEQIQGRSGYSLGYYTTYYYLLKEYKRTSQLCDKCKDFAKQLFTLYFTSRQKIKQL
ncbi:MAG: hypothetical protein MRERV_24c017 [Mycoplasmataceae bacterium RV_VA103A]|nr:MAG: hypothetical protein MRERV_24c017 [Mycoplasmataceae bacterium RV_VA103A]